MTTPLRDDHDASRLRLEARKTKDAGQAGRLLPWPPSMTARHALKRVLFSPASQQDATVLIFAEI